MRRRRLADLLTVSAGEILADVLDHGRLPVNDVTFVVLAAAISARVVLSGRGLQFLERQFQLIQKPRGALRARAIAVAVELLDLQLQMNNQRLVVGLLSSRGRSLRARNNQCCFQHVNVVWQDRRS
jgi:hypothetical protein